MPNKVFEVPGVCKANTTSIARVCSLVTKLFESPACKDIDSLFVHVRLDSGCFKETGLPCLPPALKKHLDLTGPHSFVFDNWFLDRLHSKDSSYKIRLEFRPVDLVDFVKDSSSRGRWRGEE